MTLRKYVLSKFLWKARSNMMQIERNIDSHIEYVQVFGSWLIMLLLKQNRGNNVPTWNINRTFSMFHVISLLIFDEPNIFQLVSIQAIK